MGANRLRLPRIPRRWVYTLATLALLPCNVLLALRAWRAGDGFLWTLAALAILSTAWAFRYPADELITRFCFWWIKLKVNRAHMVVMQVNMNTSKQENNNEKE